MNQTDYAYGVSYIRSIENKLMDKGDFESLILAKTPAEAMRLLTDKGYSQEPVAPADYEKLLSAQLEQCWCTVREVAPKDAPLDIFLYQNDFHNLKVVLKSIFVGERNYERLFLSPNTVQTESIVKAVSSQAFEELPEMLRETAALAYETLASTQDSQLADAIIDKAAMDFMLSAAAGFKNEFVENLVKMRNTLTDIKIAYRCMKTGKNSTFMTQSLSAESYISKNGLIQAALNGEDALLSFLAGQGYEEAANALKESVSAYEKYADAKEKDVIENAKYITFGIEPLIAYILKKQAELLTVRIIMSCKINGIAESNIRERLRD